MKSFYRSIIDFVIAAGAGLISASPSVGLAEDFSLQCGPAPNTSYGSEYNEARAFLKTEAVNVGKSFDISVPIDDIPVNGSGSSTSSSSSLSSGTMTVRKALDIVSRESKGSAGVLAECGYRLCQFGSDPSPTNLLRSQVMGQVCSAALGGPSADERAWTPGNNIDILPKNAIYVFTGDEGWFRAKLRRTAQGAITIIPPSNQRRSGEPEPLVTFVGLDKDQSLFDKIVNTIKGHPDAFQISNQGDTVELVFKLKRPDIAGGAKFVDVDFAVDGVPSSTQTVHFTLIPDAASLLASPSIDCGQFNPHAYFMAQMLGQSPSTADDNQRGAAAWQSSSRFVWDPRVDSNLSDARGHLEGSCVSRPSSGVTQTISHLEFSMAGHVNDSGQHPSGGDLEEAGWLPEWRGFLMLPGDGRRFAYKVDVIAEVSAWTSRQCAINMADETISPIDVGSPTALPMRVKRSAMLAPGYRQITLTCSGTRSFLVGNGDRSEHVYIDVTATRIEKAQAPLLSNLMRRVN